MTEHYDWKSHVQTCSSCGWTGPGRDAALGEAFADGAEYHCPKCDHYFGYIAYPTIEQSLEDPRAHEGDRAFAEIVTQRAGKPKAS